MCQFVSTINCFFFGLIWVFPPINIHAQYDFRWFHMSDMFLACLFLTLCASLIKIGFSSHNLAFPTAPSIVIALSAPRSPRTHHAHAMYSVVYVCIYVFLFICFFFFFFLLVILHSCFTCVSCLCLVWFVLFFTFICLYFISLSTHIM